MHKSLPIVPKSNICVLLLVLIVKKLGCRIFNILIKKKKKYIVSLQVDGNNLIRDFSYFIFECNVTVSIHI